MDCCETDGFKRPIEMRERQTLEKNVRRRAVLKGAGLFAGTAPLVAGSTTRGLAKSSTIQLAFCSAILCVVPFEVTRDAGYFRDDSLGLVQQEGFVPRAEPSYRQAFRNGAGLIWARAYTRGHGAILELGQRRASHAGAGAIHEPEAVMMTDIRTAYLKNGGTLENRRP